MDPETLAMLMFQGSGALPPMPQPVVAPVMPPPALAMAPGVAPVGPPAPMPAPQSFEQTNTGNPMMMGPSEAYRSEPAGVPTSLGAALTPGGGVPLPQPRPADAPGATPVPAAGGSDALLKSLRGVTAPAAPTPQKVSTPHAPQLGKIQGGQLFDLLASLGIGPQQALPGLKLPSTLGQALGGR